MPTYRFKPVSVWHAFCKYKGKHKDMKADTIIDNARKAIVDIIKTYARRYDGFIQTGDKKLATTGEVYLYDEDFNSSLPVIEIEVVHPFLDAEEYCTEKRTISQFIIDEDGDLSFCVSGSERDFSPKDLTIEELVRIANFLENECDTL